jgi:hypothetical protein
MSQSRLPVMPEFAPISVWRVISGMGRSRIYEELAAGNLRGVKCGRQVLIDVKHGLEWLHSLPPVVIRPRTTPSRRCTPPAVPPQTVARVEQTRAEAPEQRAKRQANKNKCAS